MITVLCSRDFYFVLTVNRIKIYFFWLYQALPGLTGLDSPEPVGALERWSVGLIALIELIELIRLIGSLQVC